MKAPLLLVETAQAQLLTHASSTIKAERVLLKNVLGRVLAQDYVAEFDVPSADNSAMDGYAVRASDLQIDQPTRLPISQYIPAGKFPDNLLPNTAARIFTGAALPNGADTIVIQENCTVDNDNVIIAAPTNTQQRQYVRKQGSDFKKGDIILQKGTRVAAPQMSLLAALGISEVNVYQRLRVAICSTGDELLEPGEPLAPGKLYNSNRYALMGLLQQMHIEVIDLGTVKDEHDELKNAFLKGIEQADFLITSGGASEGDKDFVHALVQQLGQITMWKLAIKPGKPFLFGTLTDKNKTIPFFGLPGNPVSAFVTFLILVKPYLLRCQGLQQVLPVVERVKAAFVWQTTNRQEYIRVQKANHHNSEATLIVYENQNSAVSTSLAWATGLAVVPPYTNVSEGDYLDYIAI